MCAGESRVDSKASLLSFMRVGRYVMRRASLCEVLQAL